MLVGEKLFSYRWGGGEETQGKAELLKEQPELCFIPGQTTAYFFETKLKMGFKKKKNLLSCILKHT